MKTLFPLTQFRKQCIYTYTHVYSIVIVEWKSQLSNEVAIWTIVNEERSQVFHHLQLEPRKYTDDYVIFYCTFVNIGIYEYIFVYLSNIFRNILSAWATNGTERTRNDARLVHRCSKRQVLLVMGWRDKKAKSLE